MIELDSSYSLFLYFIDFFNLILLDFELHQLLFSELFTKAVKLFIFLHQLLVLHVLKGFDGQFGVVNLLDMALLVIFYQFVFTLKLDVEEFFGLAQLVKLLQLKSIFIHITLLLFSSEFVYLFDHQFLLHFM